MMLEKREQGIIRLERNNIALDGDDNEKVEKGSKGGQWQLPVQYFECLP